MDLNLGGRSQSFKTVFLGDSHVGKTCLARLFVEGKVVEQTTNTIGFDHHVREMHIRDSVPVKVGTVDYEVGMVHCKVGTQWLVLKTGGKGGREGGVCDHSSHSEMMDSSVWVK